MIVKLFFLAAGCKFAWSSGEAEEAAACDVNVPAEAGHAMLQTADGHRRASAPEHAGHPERRKKLLLPKSNATWHHITADFGTAERNWNEAWVLQNATRALDVLLNDTGGIPNSSKTWRSRGQDTGGIPNSSKTWRSRQLFVTNTRGSPDSSKTWRSRKRSVTSQDALGISNSSKTWKSNKTTARAFRFSDSNSTKNVSSSKHDPHSKTKKLISATKLKKKAKKTKTTDGSTAQLDSLGYQLVAQLCCPFEMEEFVRRVVDEQGLKVCDEGGLQGIVPWHSCENAQNYSVLLQEIKEGLTGLCAWVGPKSTACKKKSVACGVPNDPMAHRRRNCGRHDKTDGLDLDMQNAATDDYVDASCGTHQVYVDVGSKEGSLRECSVKGNLMGNKTAVKKCLNECCVTDGCVGITVTKKGTSLQKSFKNARPKQGEMTYLHRQR